MRQEASPVIPPKKGRKNEVFYISEIGRNRRVVENFFARVKRHRRVNTRYDRLAETFMAFVSLAALADWIRFQGASIYSHFVEFE